MPKKMHKKKKAHREGCRVNVVQKSLVNTAAGGWTGISESKTTDTSMRAGYHVR